MLIRQFYLVLFLIIYMANITLIFFCFWWRGSFTFGNNVTVGITVANFACLCIRYFIFERAGINEDYYIFVWWLGCLQIGDSHKKLMRKRRLKRKMRRRMERELRRTSNKSSFSPSLRPSLKNLKA